MVRKTTFVVRDNEVVKSVNGSSYERLSMEEARNFEKAVREYTKRVRREVYDNKSVA